ncbi:uncharacterized protein [Triticum aestivum]|uniref:uncharacterized protein n=1 Tax=Triticum aestivum TaxID=4565 RepID=UPI001D03118B|nr:uncharacterized protein LOC123084394 [Triticum aestivum]
MQDERGIIGGEISYGREDQRLWKGVPEKSVVAVEIALDLCSAHVASRSLPPLSYDPLTPQFSFPRLGFLPLACSSRRHPAPPLPSAPHAGVSRRRPKQHHHGSRCGAPLRPDLTWERPDPSVFASLCAPPWSAVFPSAGPRSAAVVPCHGRLPLERCAMAASLALSDSSVGEAPRSKLQVFVDTGNSYGTNRLDCTDNFQLAHGSLIVCNQA